MKVIKTLVASDLISNLTRLHREMGDGCAVSVYRAAIIAQIDAIIEKMSSTRMVLCEKDFTKVKATVITYVPDIQLAPVFTKHED